MLVFYLVILVTMVYGPIAAFLVELFPARIRYTSMSLPYHIGNGVFGGGVPASRRLVARRPDRRRAGRPALPHGHRRARRGRESRRLREPTHDIKIWDEVGGHTPPPLVPDLP